MPEGIIVHRARTLYRQLRRLLLDESLGGGHLAARQACSIPTVAVKTSILILDKTCWRPRADRVGFLQSGE